MVNIKVTTKGKADLDRLLSEYSKAAAHVKVGILEAKTNRKDSKHGENNATIARDNEYGRKDKNVPARPFLRPTIEKNKDAYVELFARILRASVAKPALLASALDLIGLRAQADVRKYITAGPQVPPPNAPRYLAFKRGLARKGKASADVRTLVLSSQMVKAINYGVVKGSSSPKAAP